MNRGTKGECIRDGRIYFELGSQSILIMDKKGQYRLLLDLEIFFLDKNFRYVKKLGSV